MPAEDGADRGFSGERDGARTTGAALEMHYRLIKATYTKQRERQLAGANLGLEKLRLLCRLAWPHSH